MLLPSLLLLGCMHTTVQKTLVEGTKLMEAKEYAAAAQLFAKGYEANPPWTAGRKWRSSFVTRATGAGPRYFGFSL